MSESEQKRGFFGRLFGRPEKPAEKPGTEPAARPEPPDDASRNAADGVAPQDLDAAAGPQALPGATATPAVAHAEPPAPSVTVTSPPAPVEPPKKASWFQRLREGLQKTSSKLTEGITSVFTKRKLDAATLEDFEDLLIQADLGLETATRITETISKGRYDKGISPDDVRAVLVAEVKRVLEPVAQPLAPDFGRKPHVMLVVGVNGTGKTTTIGKLAQTYIRQGRRVMMAAGDTFRAAAIDQLKVWGERTGAKVIARDVGADSSGLAFDALKEAREEGYDLLLMDTAGRLQNKAALMDELEKVVRVVRKVDPTAPHDVLLVLDATTGQNALSQVEVFRQRAGVTGLIMTKLDGTARGGILVAIAAKYGLPVHAIGVGEGVDDLQAFDAGEFARAIAAEGEG